MIISNLPNAVIANCVKPACYRAILMPKADEHLVMVLQEANIAEKVFL